MNLLEVGDAIKRLRKERGVSQTQLAETVGISRATLSKIENSNLARISIVLINDILNHLGYEVCFRPSNPFASEE
jgi:transcriptional regulator with XRE-family HTH domain